MLEYDTSHVTSSHWTMAELLRHGIAQKAYADRKAALVLKEDELRRKASLSRLVATFWSAMTFLPRGLAGVAAPDSGEKVGRKL